MNRILKEHYKAEIGRWHKGKYEKFRTARFDLPLEDVERLSRLALKTLVDHQVTIYHYQNGHYAWVTILENIRD